MADHTDRAAATADLESMRADGWTVAVHNDYRLNGAFHTFYLFTHPSGVWAKGEGKSDREAIAAAAEEAADRSDLMAAIARQRGGGA